eukprot:8134076-Heterocapsa_arctica.AAC.1
MATGDNGKRMGTKRRTTRRSGPQGRLNPVLCPPSTRGGATLGGSTTDLPPTLIGLFQHPTAEGGE